MVEIIEVSGWGVANGQVAGVSVKSLETLQKLADNLKAPVILSDGKKKYLLIHEGVCYEYRG